MKKLLKYSLLGISTLALTGCVKYNANMEIKKDKSMNFDIIYAFDKTLIQNNSILDESQIESLKEQGFDVKDYKEDSMVGFELSKKIKNIDKVSTKDDTTYKLSELGDNEAESKYMFKVKKGFFKNKYYANFKFDQSDSSLSNKEEEIDTDEVELNETTTEEDENISLDSDEMNFSDFGNMASSSLDLSFKVKLPYKAIKNNADDVNDNGKTLKWDLSKITSDDTVEFSFYVYNMNNIYITIGVSLVLITIICCIFVTLKKTAKKNKAKKEIKEEKGSLSNSVGEQ